jgi:predicted small secreted protein
MIKSKKLVSLIVLLAVSMSVAGCFTIRVGGKAELAPSTEEGTKVAHKRCWYALWGLVPISDNSTDPTIPATVKKVRVETKFTVTDFLINIFTGIVTIETYTVEIYEVK